MLETYIEDIFGKRYILKRQSDLNSQQSLKSLEFSDELNANRFLSKLRTPQDYWQKTISKLGRTASGNTQTSTHQAERLASQLLFKKQLFIFELKRSAGSSTSVSKRSLSKSNGDTYVFSHVSSMLVSLPREVLTLHNKEEAEKILNELNPDEKQLKQLAKELDIKTLESSGREATTEKLVGALVAGEIIINVRKPLASPPPRETDTSVSAADKPAELGPDAGTIAVKETATIDPVSNINQKSQADTLAKASEEGTPFCEECEKGNAA